MQFAARTVGIVGASGFIGRVLVEQIRREGNECPRLFGRSPGEVSGCKINALEASREGFRGLDCVVHLSGITTSRAPEAELQRVNVELATDVAERAAGAGVKRMIFISSLHVHGKSASRPISPDCPFNPDNAYGRSKAVAEVELGLIAERTGLELVLLRPPMVYGAVNKGSFGVLARLVGTGLPIPFGLARGRRSFCSVGNLVSAIRHSVTVHSPAKVLIPADPEDFDTPELVRCMAAATGRPARLWSVPKQVLAAPLAAFGRSEMIISLFESLQVDRSHWRTQVWRPVESGPDAVLAALRGESAGP
ncbi:MAG: NAD-dependent epimerase/dehydratase family protein [Alphaproteobacteria bacterium]|nr:NAD-dependent epimerase/dehydratase family protein [Rhizobiaceae bacterium]MBU4137062.1 NAD-dependent epimerase/dehydratase family protein [Alphaproteobacteria bacterium]